MTDSGKKKTGGVSVRLVHAAMAVCAAAAAALLMLFVLQSSNVVSTLNTETGNYITRQAAAHGLMEASDYLTEMVQRFALDGNPVYMNNYFEEAYVSQRREAAISAMSENNADPALVQQLQEAMTESQSLMFREYYAMKLVTEAKEMTDIPETLRAIELKTEDSFLLPEEKMELAQKMVMGSEYYESKEIIRTRLKTNLNMLDDQMNATRQETSARAMRELSAGRILVIAVVVVLFALILITVRMSTLPLIRAERAARKGKKVPVIGAKEFRYLAESYNAMKEREKKETKP